MPRATKVECPVCEAEYTSETDIFEERGVKSCYTCHAENRRVGGDTRTFTVIYVDEPIEGAYTDEETSEMSVSQILETVNYDEVRSDDYSPYDDEDHSDGYSPYDKEDWLDGLINFSSHDIILKEGQFMYRKDEAGSEQIVFVKEEIRITGGFGVETPVVVCQCGSYLANSLY